LSYSCYIAVTKATCVVFSRKAKIIVGVIVNLLNLMET